MDWELCGKMASMIVKVVGVLALVGGVALGFAVAVAVFWLFM